MQDAEGEKTLDVNSVCWGDFGNVAAFLELVAEAVAQGNHRFFHIVIEENG
jgi:hypothetical protein